jgi:hypothetical protein
VHTTVCNPYEKRAWRIVSVAAWTACIFLSVSQGTALAQFMPGTAIRVSNDLNSPIGVAQEDLILKNEQGQVFATLENYSGQLTVQSGAIVEIHRGGGLLNNIKWSKGKARVMESFTVEGASIVREIDYQDGVPQVAKCTINGDGSTRVLKLRNSHSIDFGQPDLAIFLKPDTGSLGQRIRMAGFAAAALALGVAALLLVRKRKKAQHEVLVTTAPN